MNQSEWKWSCKFKNTINKCVFWSYIPTYVIIYLPDCIQKCLHDISRKGSVQFHMIYYPQLFLLEFSLSDQDNPMHRIHKITNFKYILTVITLSIITVCNVNVTGFDKVLISYFTTTQL